VSARASGAAACILALPLLAAGLAAAGLRVPAFAADSLGKVGIDLPNQDREGIFQVRRDAPSERSPRGGGAGAGGESSGDGRRESSAGESAGASGADAGGAPSGTSPEAAGDTSTGDTLPAPDSTGSGVVQLSGQASEGFTNGRNPVTDAVEDTVTGLGGLLGTEREASVEASDPAPEDASAE
jgi:hypothetical protein